MASPTPAWNPALYPELTEAGGLPQALRRVLEPRWPEVPIAALAQTTIAYAQVRSAGRECQVMIGARERRFSVDFWSQGVRYAAGWTDSLEEVARAIAVFELDRATTATLREGFRWIELSDAAATHELGPAPFVTRAWKSLQTMLEREPRKSPMRRLIPLVEACRARPKLAALFPFTSMDRLGLSRTTGYPYTQDCPSAGALREGRFAVFGAPPSGATLGEGDAVTAAKVIETGLPPGVGPAVHGTADDLAGSISGAAPPRTGYNPGR